VGDLADDLDAVELVAVRSRREKERRAVALAVDDRHRNPDRVAEVGLADPVSNVLSLAGLNRAAVVRERPVVAHDSRERRAGYIRDATRADS